MAGWTRLWHGPSLPGWWSAQRVDPRPVARVRREARMDRVKTGGAHWVPAAADVPASVDAVFDPVGGPSLRTSRQVTQAGGVVVSYGFSFTVGAGHAQVVVVLRC